MLRPQDNATRERKRLDGLWRFACTARISSGSGHVRGWSGTSTHTLRPSNG